MALGKRAFMSVVAIAFPNPHPNLCGTEFATGEDSEGTGASALRSTGVRARYISALRCTGTGM